jgi:cyclase
MTQVNELRAETPAAVQPDSGQIRMDMPSGSHQTLIVARMTPGSEGEISRIFAASDATELPHLVGARRRTLFRFHDLYFHLVESDRPIGSGVEAVRSHPLWRQVNEDLAAYVKPYDPVTWRSPKDAMAQMFYLWERPPHREA